MKSEIHLETLLKENGLKTTKQRLILMGVLLSANAPMSAEMILEKMKSTFTACNLSTVYRNMEILLAREVIHEITIDQKSYYAIDLNQHGHYIQCVQCKEMTRIEGCPLETYEQELERKTGFKVIKHKVELFGICKKCSNNC